MTVAEQVIHSVRCGALITILQMKRTSQLKLVIGNYSSQLHVAILYDHTHNIMRKCMLITLRSLFCGGGGGQVYMTLGTQFMHTYILCIRVHTH